MNSHPLELTVADIQAARRELASRSLPDFACMVDIPTVPLTNDEDEDQFSVMKLNTLATHHELLLTKLQQIESGQLKNLMVLMPPGSAKSTMVDIVFIPWFMARRGRRNVILASYASEIAEKQGRRARQLIKSPSFYNLMQTSLRQDNKAAHQWTLENGSEFMAGGLLSGLTGNRAHCFVAGTLVETIDGPKPIENLVSESFSGYIVSYDIHTRKLVHRRVKAVARRSSPDIYNVHIANGGVVRCTGDHRFYTDRGYVEARFLSQDDRLVQLVSKKHHSGSFSNEKSGQKGSSGNLLQSCLSSDGGQCGTREAGSILQRVQDQDSCKAIDLLHSRVQDKKQSNEKSKLCEFDSSENMQHMHASVYAKIKQKYREVLQSALRRLGTFKNDARGKQSGMAERLLSSKTKPTCSQSVFTCQAIDQGKRQESVRSVQKSRELACSSYRHGCDEQQLEQSSYSVQELPHVTTWGGSLTTEESSISLVERVCESAEVFDLQVEGTECFFANGILVHNCGIVDDPMKGRDQAESETLRDKTWNAYIDDFCSRLIPGAPQIMVLTRWHEMDLAGRILPENWDGESGLFKGRDGREWDVLCLPAIADRSDDPLGRKLGETLWPEWFSHDHWKPFQLNKRTWSSLYQQKPTPDEGTFFQKDWFKRRYRPGSEPVHLNKYLTSDHAPGGQDHNDFNCFRMWGVDSLGDIYLLDGFRTQNTMDISCDKALAMCKKHRPLAWFPEADNNWKSIDGFVTRRMRETGIYVRIDPITPHGANKATKAQPFQAMAAAGRVWIPEGPEGDDVIEQYLKFPGGKHDDEVDAASIIGRAIADAHPAVVPLAVVNKPIDRWDRAFNAPQEDFDWKTA